MQYANVARTKYTVVPASAASEVAMLDLELDIGPGCEAECAEASGPIPGVLFAQVLYNYPGLPDPSGPQQWKG